MVRLLLNLVVAVPLRGLCCKLNSKLPQQIKVLPLLISLRLYFSRWELELQQVSGGSKNKKKAQKPQGSDGNKSNADKGGNSGAQLVAAAGPGPILDPKFKDVICYNCGEPGHYVGLCTRIKRCFICSRTGHHMGSCQMWYTPMPTAQYWGSANPGLGFFHVEVEGPEAVQWLNMDNVGIVVVKDGDISEKELEQNFNEMWKVNWFWQIRQIAAKRFLVRFPPSKRIKDLVEYPSINLKKKGVVVSFMNWEGEAEPFEEFQEVWVKIVGIPAKWLTWKTICQVSTALGVLVNIDWHGIFRSFYKEVRVKVSVRDISKIPTNKLFEMEQCFFLIDFSVENDGDAIGVDDGEDPDQNDTGDKLEEEEDLGEDFQELDKNQKGVGNNRMETDHTTPVPSQGEKTGYKTVASSSVPKDPEESVKNKVFGMEQAHVSAHAMVLRSVEDNIEESLLQRFDAGSDEEVDKTIENETQKTITEDQPTQLLPSLVWKEKKNWGHVQATRMSSRIQRDGRSAIEKAQELKKSKNLEVPKSNKIHGISNSFAALENHVLLERAKCAGISLGHTSMKTDVIINDIKKIEIDRLKNFHSSNPDMFLPVDISLTMEDMKVDGGYEVPLPVDQDDYSSDYPNEDEPWTLLSSRKKGRIKLIFKHGISSNMES
ncbi:hypothetical protein ACQ4PT_002866 [Festuca glaucescens]